MGKVLTISIAAYNVETYIRQTLDSLIDENIIDDLEIFVVDDGGSDGTLQIAQEYADKYPRSVFPIHKENGGYGSTVNYSISHASGAYFKLLDGDDWFDREGLKNLIEQLRTIRTDIVITPYFCCVEDGETQLENVVDHYELNTEYLICDWDARSFLGMWAITYRTEVLQRSKIELPLHCLYTDQIYSTLPFGWAKTIRFLDCPTYCYRIGRDGQSVSRESRISHIEDNRKVCDLLYSFYEMQKEQKSDNIDYICHRTTTYALRLMKTYLLKPVSADLLAELAAYDKRVKDKAPDIYREMSKFLRYKKTAFMVMTLRIFQYGGMAERLLKLILPKEGIENWA